MTSDPEEFFRYFRMDRTAFDEILASIRPFIIHKTTHRNPTSPEERLAMTLRFNFLFFHPYQNAFVHDLVFQIAGFF